MATRMRAVAYRENLPADDACLLDVASPVPAPGPHDLLAKVEAVAVNPVDCKARRNVDPAGALRVLVTRCTTRVPSTGPGRTGSTRNLGVYAEALKPFGQIVAVDDVDDVTQIARLVDAGIVVSTVTRDHGIVNADQLREAHRVLESGRTVGKMTLTGF